MSCLRLLFGLLAFYAVVVSAATGEVIVSSSGAVRIEVKPSGKYQLSFKSNWQLTGELPSAAGYLVSKAGKDGAGAFHQITFNFSDAGRPMSGSIRLYDETGVVLFSQTMSQASQAPPAAFPDFTSLPQGLFSFSYSDRPFSPASFKLENIATPWLLFDQQRHALIISPATHFICSRMLGDGSTRVASGFNESLANLPSGFTQQTLLAAGQGINHTWDLWGHALTDLQGKKRPANDADVFLKYYGYWTDNGAAYWYDYDLTKGYQGTLEAVVDTYRAEGIPLHYLQLDSWWYHKTLTDAAGKQQKPKNSKLPEGDWNRYGGTISYTAHPFVFPNGLEAFHEKVGLPFMTHNRWTDPTSPYHEHYRFSGIAGVDPGFWNEIIGYIKDNGVLAYEQDWLSKILLHSPELSSTVDLGDAFFDGMANATSQRGMSMQYCMATPRCFLQGSKYGNLTSIRVSDDRFEPKKYRNFLYTSRLATSLGIWPWTDVYKSTAITSLLLGTLSAGPVGTGDALGMENKDNLFKAMRADGVLIKPDMPLLPVDQAYVAEAQERNTPLVATTYTEHSDIKTIYGVVLKPASESSAITPSSLTVADLTNAKQVYLYKYMNGTGQQLGPSAALPLDITADCNFFVLAPLTSNGIAFLGDADKFVGTGRQRISAIRSDTEQLIVDVTLAANESQVLLKGYSAIPPTATVDSGHADPVQYDSATGLFSVVIKADPAAPTQNENGDAVRHISVTFLAGTNHSAKASSKTVTTPEMIAQGREYFAMSCPQCHGDDAHGNSGPKLNQLVLSDASIAKTIKEGIPEKMPSYAKKYDDRQIAALVSYLRTLQ